ncbi:hypothetical protein LAUMK4_05858 [Mycobacterium persicum]|uniref:RNHCP domain-containing protein n=1 Tax=Mycobacterium persicum TaxID=1487726 RepID=A0ABY6RSL6_9MYCO|nr:hypothetical protein LAUMK15_03863 [Mycobacterium persicum]VBA33056.1 hypothetical protein LAUMK4_05858 [Mycobacterium persicum]
MSTRDEQNRRYVGFYCCDCGKERYSAGRPRCSPCHVVYVATRHEPQQEATG